MADFGNRDGGFWGDTNQLKVEKVFEGEGDLVAKIRGVKIRADFLIKLVAGSTINKSAGAGG